MNRTVPLFGAAMLMLMIATVPVANAQDEVVLAAPACTATYLLECHMGCADDATLEVIALGLGTGTFACGNATASCTTSATFLACQDDAVATQRDTTGICSASLGVQAQCTAGTSNILQ